MAEQAGDVAFPLDGLSLVVELNRGRSRSPSLAFLIKKELLAFYNGASPYEELRSKWVALEGDRRATLDMLAQTVSARLGVSPSVVTALVRNAVSSNVLD